MVNAGPVEFFGVDGNTFRVRAGGELLTFEAVEDAEDGYRSCMEEIELRPNVGVFYGAPVATVTFCETDRSSDGSRAFRGWEAVDADGHRWLVFGTDNSDDYYPSFIFTYTPKMPGAVA